MWVLVFLNYLLWHPVWRATGYSAVISWDVFGYYLYLPAHFIYHDLFHLGFLPQLVSKYQPSDVVYQAHLLPQGGYVMNYTLGLAILYLPFFLVGHAVALLGAAPADGLSWPYQLSVYLAGGFYSLMGLWLVCKVLKSFFTEAITATVLLIIVFATNYFHYSVFEVGMQHTYLFFLYALLIWLTMRWHQQPRMVVAIAIGLVLGMVTLMRPTELLAALIPLLWNVYNKETLLAKLDLLWQKRWQVVALGLSVVVMGLPQLIYWKLATGHFLFYSYGNQTFDFAHPHIMDGLFSIKKGWLVYTPIMAFALLGLVPLYKYRKQQFYPVLMFTLLNIYVIYSWWCWWYGGSFGARAMIQSYALLALPLGAWVELISKKRIALTIFALITVLCLGLNLFQDWQLRKGMYSTEGMTDYAYKLIFLKTSINKNDLVRFDNAEQLQLDSSAYKATTILKQTVWPNNSVSTPSFDDSSVLLLDNTFKGIVPLKVPASAILNGADTKDAWLRVGVEAYFENYEWGYQKMGVIGVDYIQQGGKKLKGNQVKIQHLIGDKRNEVYGVPYVWDRVYLASKLPNNLQPSDTVEVTIFNPSGNSFYIDDLKIDLLHH